MLELRERWFRSLLPFAGVLLAAGGGDRGHHATGQLIAPTQRAAAPALSVVKSVEVFSDPFNGPVHPKAIPGALMNFTITVTNVGSDPVDSDTVVVVDTLPSSAELFVGDVNGPGSGPIAFVDGVPSSGLTYTFVGLSSASDDLSFSDDGGVSYGYLPVGSPDAVDAAVTHLRVQPKGTMSAGEGHPSFRVSFRVRLK